MKICTWASFSVSCLDRNPLILAMFLRWHWAGFLIVLKWLFSDLFSRMSMTERVPWFFSFFSSDKYVYFFVQSQKNSGTYTESLWHCYVQLCVIHICFAGNSQKSEARQWTHEELHTRFLISQIPDNQLTDSNPSNMLTVFCIFQ